jgi:hypothetical protein
VVLDIATSLLLAPSNLDAGTRVASENTADRETGQCEATGIPGRSASRPEDGACRRARDGPVRHRSVGRSIGIGGGPW